MRESTVVNGMSTLEAAAAALALLEGTEVAAPLLRLFDQMTERQLRLRGRL
jgi:DTW domain-containing protein YfiP